MNIFKKICISTMLLFMSILFLAPVNVEAATVGQVLTSPEDGWQRVDDKNENIQYWGNNWFIDTVDSYYNKTIHSTFPNGSINHSIKFKFKGSKLRIIAGTNTMYSSNISVAIDGIKYSFSQKGNFIRGILNFEKLGLEYGIHEVIIIGNDSGSICIDAYDIDADGEILPSMQLTATGGDSQVILDWGAIPGISNYTLQRSETPGGPYTSIATNLNTTSFTDENVTNGKTYYYIVTASTNANDIIQSNEASATPNVISNPNNRALLVITMVTGERKEYDMSMDEINKFVQWCDSKAASNPSYVIYKDYNIGPFKNRKDYIVYEKISNFEVMEYDK
jgi:hypothetical protein